MEKQEEKKAPQQTQRRGRLLLFPLPLQGHINPMLQLANILHSKGFKITIIHTTFNSPNQPNYPHFTFKNLSDSLNASSADIDNVLILLKTINTACVEPFRDCLAQLLRDANEEEGEEPVLCLISDAILFFTQYVADELKVPRIVLRTSSLASFHVFHSYPMLREKGYFFNKGKSSNIYVPNRMCFRIY